MREFARQINITHATISSICRGKRCSKKTALKIEAATHGAVSADELLALEPWKSLYRSV